MPPAARILTVSIAVALTVLNPTCAEREPYIIGKHIQSFVCVYIYAYYLPPNL